MADFLLEIGTEEIPARMIDGATEELSRRVGDLLTRERLSETPQVRGFSTPRRIAVIASGIAASQPDVEEQVQGPSVKVAYKDGQPTPAALAFAKKVGVDVSALAKVSTPKGDYLSANVKRKGRAAAEILAESLPKEVSALYWAKNMYWRGKSAERFVRPVRWMVSLLDGEVVPVEFAGIIAGRSSRGHRILSESAVEFHSPGEYATKMEKAAVVVDRAAREYRIRKALDAATRTVPGARWREDKALLDTVVNLTEFPSVILGSFEPEYLSLPEEVLVTVMRDHQKYFAVEDASGKLAPHFLAVLNTDGDPEGLICHGNERVLRARFNDARFFWQTDQKISLRERVPMLKSVTFQKDLGSYYDKTLRVQKLASLVCETLLQSDIKVRAGVVHKAALLAKTDLTTELVKEFTELQGIVGGLYARVQTLDTHLSADAQDAISKVIYDQYRPESVDDDVPRTLEAAVFAIADKADTIAGMFSLGLQPTGSKDPFALRRAANGIVKIIAEHKIPLCLSQVFGDAARGYGGSEAEKSFKEQTSSDSGVVNVLQELLRGEATGSNSLFATSLAGFLRERLEFYLRDVRGFAYDVVNAVLAANADDVVDALARAEAVAQVRPSEDFESISVAFKRMKNILRQAAEKGIKPADTVDANALTDAEEKYLAKEAPAIAESVKQHRANKNYAAALGEISKLRKPVDAFFDKVMVMVEDERVRANRLSLLQLLLSEFSGIADFSEIVTERK